MHCLTCGEGLERIAITVRRQQMVKATGYCSECDLVFTYSHKTSTVTVEFGARRLMPVAPMKPRLRVIEGGRKRGN